MKKTVNSKGGLAKFLVFSLIITMAILAPISNIPVLAEPVSTEAEESNPASESASDAEIVDSQSGQEETGTQAEPPVAGLETPSEDQSATPEGSAADPTAAKDKQEPQEASDSEDKEPELLAASAKNTQPSSADLFIYNGNTITGLTDAGKTYFVEESNDLYIPSEINENNIQVIGENAFKDLGVKGNLVFPDSIIEIGASAFEGNTEITGFNFPQSLNRIERCAFKNCGISGTLDIPAGFWWIGNEAFYGNQISSVKFPDDIRTVGPLAFAYNQIETLDLGKLENITGSRWKEELNIEVAGLLSYGVFRNNKIKSLMLPVKENGKGLWGLGVGAFAYNEIEELKIPGTLNNIYFYAFYKNEKLNKVDISEANGIQIDRGAFQYCAIRELLLPDEANQFGGYSFAGNKITKLILPKNSLGFGYNCFYDNPLESVEQFNNKSWLFESEVFAGSKSLKNVSFKFFNKNYKSISNGTFMNGKLKSLEFPGWIDRIEENAFKDNEGWYVGTNKVGLYRLKNIDDPLSYELNNSLADGESYVINPLLIEFNFFDKNGNALEPGKQPEVIEIVSKRTGRDLDLKVTKARDAWTDFENFKLGDELSIKVPNGFSIEGKKDDHSISLDPKTNHNITEVSYGNGYNVGYKKLIIKVKAIEELPEIPSTPTPNNPNPFIQPIIETPAETTAIEDTIVPLADKELEDERIVLEDGETEERIEEDQTPLSDIPKTSERFGFGTRYLPFLALVLISVLFLTLSFTKKAKNRD